MADLTLNISQYSPLQQFTVRPWETFSPDDQLAITDKINLIVQTLNRLGKLSNDVVTDWNKVMTWVSNDGMTAEVDSQLQKWKDDGTLVALINAYTGIGDLSTLQTVAKDTLVNAINENVTHLVDKASQITSLQSKKIYAKDHGVKLDGVTDDTAALNAFFALFGSGVELVVEGGVALVTGQLNIPGQWNPSSNNGVKKLTFDNAAINYQGTPNKACMQFYNHQKSFIRGVSILKTSQPTYINFVGFWYSKFADFEVPQICFNKNTTDIPATLNTNDSYTSVFDRGVTYLDSTFYGVGQTGGGNINSITFNDVKWQGNQVSPNAQYNMKFYGTSFQNFSFNYCDLSYATIAETYIDVAQTSGMRLNFNSCYFDTNIPLVANNDYKGAVCNLFNTQTSNNQPYNVKTRNIMSNTTIGAYTLEGNTPKHGGLNLAKNGDFLYPSLTGWQYSGNNTSGGGVGSPAISFLTNNNAINKNSLQITFTQTLQYWAINGISATMDAPYTMAIRLRKTSGNGSIQLAFKNGTPTFDLTPYALNEEIVISTNGAGSIITQGTGLFGTLYCATLGTSPFTIEILEVTIVPGNNIGINLNVHPQAVVYPTHATTASRPVPYYVNQSIWDDTLNKPIFCKTVSPAVWVDATGVTV